MIELNLRKHNRIVLHGASLKKAINQNLIYSARLTGNQFLYNEFKVMVKLFLQGFSKEEIFRKIEDENLFEYRSLKAISKHLGAVWERINYLDEYLMKIVATEPNEIGRLINFYSILKYDLLFLEFMEEVVLEKIYAHQMELSHADISNFFGIKAEQSGIISNFKETTLKRLRAAYFELLMGAGYVVKDGSEFSLTTPIAVYQICNYLEEIGEKRYAKAMLGV